MIMASAPPPFTSTKETTNYARLCRLLVDVGSQALRDTFDTIHPPECLHEVLTRPPVRPMLQSLRKKRILNATRWGKLYPTFSPCVSSTDFDITLLVLLLKNICDLSPPATGWDSLPSASDSSMQANIARVIYYRNNVFEHAGKASVDDSTFNTYWKDISNTLVGLGAGASYGATINKIKTEAMDPDIEEHYHELLQEWMKDENRIKDRLPEMEGMLENTLNLQQIIFLSQAKKK